MTPAEEPLLESAPIAWELAKQYCRKDPATGENCAWNHGLWQFLRLMGLAGSAAHRGAFYRSAIQAALADTRSPSVLISGATDYAMLALVVAALKDRLDPVAITVVDICETPLRLSHWYANRAGARLATVQSDMLEFAPAERFDLLCTDSFISRFPPRQRPDLAAKWRVLLRPGGSIVTASRLRPNTTVDCIRFSQAQARVYRETVLRLTKEAPQRFGIDPEDLANCAARYARLQFNYPVHSREEIRTLFEGAGLAINDMPVLPMDADIPVGIDAPTVPKQGEFLGVIARRP